MTVDNGSIAFVLERFKAKVQPVVTLTESVRWGWTYLLFTRLEAGLTRSRIAEGEVPTVAVTISSGSRMKISSWEISET